MTRSTAATKLIMPLLAVFALVGCSTPQWRIFQSNVPTPLVKSEVQIEAERAGADLVARTIETPVELVPVAQKLSESLGAPEHPITQAMPAKAREEALGGLLEGIQRQQYDLSQLNKRLAEYDGKKIEGTGFNLFGFAVSLPVIGLIALCILCPSVITFLWYTLKKVRGALAATIEGVQNFKAENPDAAKAINKELDGAQDKIHKALIKQIKATL